MYDCPLPNCGWTTQNADERVVGREIKAHLDEMHLGWTEREMAAASQLYAERQKQSA